MIPVWVQSTKIRYLAKSDIGEYVYSDLGKDLEGEVIKEKEELGEFGVKWFRHRPK